MARKTIAVEAIRDRANVMLEVQSTPEARRAVALLLESVLLATDNYRGFKYQSSEWDGEAFKLKEDYDDTRRYYY
jgi:hypothetical protein